MGEGWREAAALVVDEPEPENRNGIGQEPDSLGHSKGTEPEKSVLFPSDNGAMKRM